MPEEQASAFGAVRKAMSRVPLVPAGQRIIVAVSGGLDSMVLLDVLQRLALVYDWKLVVAHYNHQLRGRSSDADERFVREAASGVGLPVCVARGGVRTDAKRRGISIEMAARRLRHRFLASAAHKHGAKFIATAHHADDQVELFFIRLLRGAGADGIAGMRRSSPSPADPSIQIVRPLLCLNRASLRDYARTQGIKHREDKSNQSPEYLRNRIRLELLPLLRTYQPGLDDTVARVMDIAAVEGDFVEAAALLWLEKRKPGFHKLHPAVQRRCLRHQLAHIGLNPDFALIEKLRLQPDTPISIPGRAKAHLLRTTAGNLRFVPKSGGTPAPLTVDLAPNNGALEYDGVRVLWKRCARRGLPNRKPCVEYFDADAVGRCIRLRHWLPGDRFQPIGMPAPVKLQDLFTNAGIPRDLRSSLLVAEDETGRVFWVEKLRMSERHKLLKTTRRRLKWSWQREKPVVANGYI